ncbi:MAG: cation diffusion facilitator family transporter [Cyclobacteriaceae bacterium]
MEAAHRNIQIQKWVAILSVVLLLGKLVAYYLTNSVAILTDALESIANVIAGFFGLYSLRLSAKPKDADHPYGHGKIEFISAAVEGVMISLAAVFILIESIRNLITPVILQKLDTGILLISVAALANFIMGSICTRTGKKNNSQALIASGKHLKTDTYSTLGILVGLTLIFYTGIQRIDSIVAILFSCLIFYSGFKIVRTSVAGIMDERDNDLLRKMIVILDKNRSKNWVDIHNIRIIKYGSTLHLDSHLTVPWYLNVHEAHEEIDKLGHIIRKEFGDSIELFVHSDGCLPISCPICIKDDCPVRHHAFQRRIQWTVQNMERDQKHQIGT